MRTATVDSSHDRSLRALVLCLDALIVVASMSCSWGLHTLLRDLPWVQARLELRAPPSLESYALLLYLTLPLFMGIVAAFELHRWFERPYTALRLLGALMKEHVTLLLMLSLLLFVTQTVINRSMLAFFLLSTYTLQFAARVLLGHWLRFQYASGHARPRILLVGDFSRSMQELVERSQQLPFPPEIVGCLSDSPAPPSLRIGPGGTALSAPPARVGILPELARMLQTEPLDRVLFFPPFHQAAAVGEALRMCETLGVPAGLAIDMAPLSLSTPRIEFVFGQPFVDYELAPRPHGPLMLKHTFDVFAAAVLLVLVSPVLLLTALAILVSMGRPVFFIQERAGRRGRGFRMFKFRTMVTDAEAQQASLHAQNIMKGPVFKARNDPRVTPLGRFLRSSSIDELPQLFNVLAGQMSLVGPRPLPRMEQAQIQGWHRRRLSMKPGITGLWQISGRNEVAFDQWMALDLKYVDNWSWREDLRILLQTVPVLLHRRGAH